MVFVFPQEDECSVVGGFGEHVFSCRIVKNGQDTSIAVVEFVIYLNRGHVRCWQRVFTASRCEGWRGNYILELLPFMEELHAFRLVFMEVGDCQKFGRIPFLF